MNLIVEKRTKGRHMKEKKLYLFDLDGTLILGQDVIDGAVKVLQDIKAAGKEFMIFTNNSSRTRAQYVEKIKKMLKMDITEDEVATGGYTTGQYLLKNNKKRIFVVGTEKFKELLRDLGITVVDDPKRENGSYNLDAVVIGLDAELRYDKLTKACEILTHEPGITYIGANPDMVYPVEDNVFYPDCGSICKLLSYAVGREPKFLGKPYAEILDFCLESKNVSKDETVIIGDRLYTDIACGFNNGCDTILVLTGEAKREDVETTEFKPTLVLDSVKDMKI